MVGVDACNTSVLQFDALVLDGVVRSIVDVVVFAADSTTIAGAATDALVGTVTVSFVILLLLDLMFVIFMLLCCSLMLLLCVCIGFVVLAGMVVLLLIMLLMLSLQLLLLLLLCWFGRFFFSKGQHHLHPVLSYLSIPSFPSC